MADGSGLCVCTPGYRDDGSGGCVDRDECVEQHPCRAPATCTNVEGGYTCDCALPLVTDGSDGCMCQPPQADDGVGGCTACMPGYVDDGSGTCIDIDECAEGIDTCNGTATCANYDGDYACDCPPPFVPNGTQGCRCPAGYEDDGLGSCQEIDECALGTDGCNGLATCTNYAGGYTCECPPPFVPDSSRGCRCPTGFEDDGLGGCVDLDECALGTDNCSTHADCTNTDGGFTCTCQAGYTGSGRLCAPI
jgi:hypothetical protein